MKVERSLLKSASGASEFISVQDRMSMKLQSKLGGCMSVKAKLLKLMSALKFCSDTKPEQTLVIARNQRRNTTEDLRTITD
eukprot:237411-Pelagomonas_calceolata.AAC.1